MKVYWSGRDGSAPPKHATFHCKPFFSDSFSPFQTPSVRIETLPAPKCYKVKKRTFFPEKEGWEKAVHYALSSDIIKVVLARCEILDLFEPPDPFAIAAALKQHAVGSYIYCFSEKDCSFVGASPERLFFRQEKLIQTEAMAGTRPRGHTIDEDSVLGDELLRSSKDLSEIRPVKEFLEKQLNPYCQSPLSFEPLCLHKTAYVQHLYLSGKGILKEEYPDETLLSMIHPTPALCGVPKQKALQLIRQWEPFNRGLYGGALGWTTQKTSEWIVGIRSCFIQGTKAILFAGTGIVQGSRAEKEWEELDHKRKLFAPIFL